MTHPVPGAYVSCDFGELGPWAAGYHTGRDYAADAGYHVLATRAGVVISAGWAGSDYGNQVVIESGGIRHLYNHLLSWAVSPGQHVEAGQRIGLVGSTGNSTGPHLHYEERVWPYGYNQHREPQFDQEEGDDDMTPEQAESLAECRRMLAVLLGAQPPAGAERGIPEQTAAGQLLEHTAETRRQCGVVLGAIPPGAGEQTIPQQLETT